MKILITFAILAVVAFAYVDKDKISRIPVLLP